MDTDELDYPLFWKTRWDIIGYDREEEERKRQIEECEGFGNCHGCLAWCAFCGDVDDMCDVTDWPDRCDTHKRYPAPPPGPDPRQLVLFVDE